MIEIRDLSLNVGDFRLKDINLSIGDGEYFVILGPTGAGKTVLLECIAGLHHIRKGEIWFGQKNITHLTSEDRKVGYVPQDYVLFPFLNVFDNIADDSFPGIDEYRKHFLGAGATEVHLAGSGPSLFTLLPDKVEADNIHRRLERAGLECYVAETLASIDEADTGAL